jgi:type III secretory pathway component EscS
MSKLLQFIFLGLCAVALLDSLGSIASRTLDFDYAKLSTVSLILYMATGYFTAKYYNLGWVVLSGMILGLFDATIGWKLCILLKANNPEITNTYSTGVWLTMVLITILLAGLMSSFAGILQKYVIRPRSHA